MKSKIIPTFLLLYIAAIIIGSGLYISTNLNFSILVILVGSILTGKIYCILAQSDNINIWLFVFAIATSIVFGPIFFYPK